MIADNIRKYIDDNGINQAYIIKKTGIPQAKMSLILSGKRVLHADDMVKIADALNVSPDVFRDAE